MKKVFCVMLAVFLLASLASTVYAATPRAARIIPSITFSGTTATCKATILANSSSDRISATIKLYYGSTCLDTWQVSGSGYVVFSDTATVTRGLTYTLTVDYSVNGVSQPTVSCSGTCR